MLGIVKKNHVSTERERTVKSNIFKCEIFVFFGRNKLVLVNFFLSKIKKTFSCLTFYWYLQTIVFMPSKQNVY